MKSTGAVNVHVLQLHTPDARTRTHLHLLTQPVCVHSLPFLWPLLNILNYSINTINDQKPNLTVTESISCQQMYTILNMNQTNMTCALHILTVRNVTFTSSESWNDSPQINMRYSIITQEFSCSVTQRQIYTDVSLWSVFMKLHTQHYRKYHRSTHLHQTQREIHIINTVFLSFIKDFR